MNKKLLQELKEKLEKEKTALEKQLKTFATQDPRLKGGWDSRFPNFDGNLEEAADEVEEYTSRLPVEFSLETRLRDINLALGKIEKAAKGEPRQGRGKYGQCENCGKEINEKRLKVYPAARLCLKCQK